MSSITLNHQDFLDIQGEQGSKAAIKAIISAVAQKCGVPVSTEDAVHCGETRSKDPAKKYQAYTGFLGYVKKGKNGAVLAKAINACALTKEGAYDRLFERIMDPCKTCIMGPSIISSEDKSFHPLIKIIEDDVKLVFLPALPSKKPLHQLNERCEL